MKILYMGVFRNEPRPALELCAEKELSSFSRFQRGSVSDFLKLFARDTAEGMEIGKRKLVKSEEQPSYVIHSFCHGGVAGVIVADDKYPEEAAQRLLTKIVHEFLATHPYAAFSEPSLREDACPLPQLKEYIVQYQDPSEGDTLMKLDRELKETRQELQQTVEKVLLRGGHINDLVDKSEDIKGSARMFYKQAQKQNSCCVVM